MGWLSDILGGTADEFYSALPPEIRNLYGTYGEDGQYVSGIPQISAPNMTFQPFTVTTGGLGTINTSSRGYNI